MTDEEGGKISDIFPLTSSPELFNVCSTMSKDRLIGVRLPGYLVDRLDKVAGNFDLNRSELIRLLVEEQEVVVVRRFLRAPGDLEKQILERDDLRKAVRERRRKKKKDKADR